MDLEMHQAIKSLNLYYYNAIAKHERFPLHSWLDIDSVSSSHMADLSWHQGLGSVVFIWRISSVCALFMYLKVNIIHLKRIHN